jgi:hypothetical protein
MKNNETPETLLTQAYNSAKLKKLAVIFTLAGIIICFIPLLPQVQNAIFSFITEHRPIKSSNGFDKLRSLLYLPFFGLIVLLFVFCCLFSKTISAFLENAKNARLITSLVSGTGMLLLGFVSIFSYQHGAQWLNSDHSSEMVLGKLLADENTFVSRNWHYSTEIRLIYQTIFIMPLFKLLGRYENWALIRSLTILFNNLALILSYLFMTKQMKIQTKWIYITGLFLILPLSTSYWDFVIFGGYYILFIAQLFCCIGLFVRLIKHADTKKKTALIDFVLFTVLSFMLGVQGIRSLLCIHIPLLITSVYYYLKTAQKKNFLLFLECYGFIVCCVGFAVNYLLHFWYSFHSFENMRLTDLYTDFFPKFGQSLVCLAGFFGLSIGSLLLSAKGLFSVIAIIGTFLLFWVIIKSLQQTKIKKNTMVQATGNQFMSVFFIVSVIFNIFVFIVVDESITSRYFIPFMALYIPLVAILFEYIEKTHEHLKRIAIISGIVLFICGQSHLNFQDMAGWNGNSGRKSYIQYLLDNHLDYGFATFWNANVTTELTNGKIELAGLGPHGLNPGNRFNLQGWLNPVKFYNPSFHQGESFLLLTRAEWELAQRTGRSFARLVPDYEDNDFIVIKFPSAQIIHIEVLDN